MWKQMMRYTTIPNECSRCGAPLAQIGERFFCEYCGQKYTRISMELAADNTEEQQEESFLEEVDEAPAPDIEQSHAESAAAAIPDGRADTQNADDNLGTRTAIVIMILVIFCGLWFVLTNSLYNMRKRNMSKDPQVEKTNTSTLPEKEEASLIQVIHERILDSVAYPAASNEDLPVATAVVLQYADANTLIFTLFVHNQSGTDIDTSSLEKHLEIDSLAVTSDLEDEFLCSLQKDNWDEELFLNSHTSRKGVITCSGSLNPQTSSIAIDFDMPNWGSSHLEIPIQADHEDLQSSIELELTPESYSMAIELNSDKPQLVWVKKSDILISNDEGIAMLLDGCTPTTSQQGEGEYFLKLTYPSGFNDDKFIICEFDEPFPYEINTMSAGLNTTSGKTFNSQAVINKSEGWIDFTNR